MIGFPLDSRVVFDADGTPTYDRAIGSEPYRKLLKELFKTGVLPTVSTNMQVVAGEGMNVTVMAGFAMVEGCMKLEESNKTLTLEASDGTYSRIDTVVLRLDDNEDVRSCEYAIIKGTPASKPVAPMLVRSNSIFDIGLANILVPANSTQVSASRITDTRYDSTRCGVMSSISEFDTTTLYNQVQADLDEFKEVYEADMENWTEVQQTAFERWFATIREILDESVAGKLQNEIDELNAKVDNIKLVHLVVNHPEELAGNNIVATNGTESHTVKADASGQTIIDGMKLGTWTVSTVYEDNESSVSVDTTFYGNYEMTLTLKGKFNYQGWLESAPVIKSFSSLEEVLNDELTLRTLFTKHASVDYLCDWIIADSTITEQILGTDLVAKWVNLRDYALDKLYEVAKASMDSLGKYGYGEWVLKDSVWGAKGNVPIMTSNSAPYGEVSCLSVANSNYSAYMAFDGNGSTRLPSATNTLNWIAYKFTNPIKVNSFMIQQAMDSQASGDIFVDSSAKVQISNDGTNWEDIYTVSIKGNNPKEKQYFNFENDKYALYVRLNFTSHNLSNNNSVVVSMLQFYGRQLSVSVPTMTSNTEPWGEVKESGHFTDSYTTFDAYKLFDGIDDTQTSTQRNCWISPQNATSAWVQYEFNVPMRLKMVMFQNSASATLSSNHYLTDKSEVLVSNDGINWKPLGEMNITNYTINAKTFFDMDSETEYKYVKVNCLHALMPQFLGYIGGLQFYGFDYSEHEERHWIYDHGVEVEEIQVGHQSGFSDETSIKKSDCLYMSKDSTSQKGASGFVTNNLIDLTSYNLVRVRLGNELKMLNADTTKNFGSILVLDSIDMGSHISYTSVTSETLNNSALNISSINDLKHICVGSITGGTLTLRMTISEWWIE